MKVDLEQVLKTPRGENFNDNATLAMAAYNALGATLPSDGQMPAEKKLQVFRISQKIAAGGVQELTAEDIALIKERASQALPIFAYGAIATAFESATTPKAIQKDEPAQAEKKA